MAEEDTKPESQSEPTKDTAGILADAVDQFNCPACNATINVQDLEAFSEVTCEACGAKTTVPQKLGNFFLLRMIGMGGMGGVYYAHDEQLGRDVAIKVMLKSLGDDPQFIETFRHEAQAVAKLNHANIAQIYSFGQEKGQPYIVMELVSGERVDALMEKPDGLSKHDALRIALEVAQGLSAADEAGLVHGDIKPENILLDQKNNAKLVDFGLATMAHQNAGEGIWGTPYYISPEKIRRQKLDARSDIYSLGATLYHMLTGHPPFEGETPVEVVKARLETPPPDPSDIDPDLPPIVSEIILRMLATERTERYPNYRSLISDLRKAVQAFESEKSQTPTISRGKSIRIKKKGSSSPPSVGTSMDSSPASGANTQGKKIVVYKSSSKIASTGQINVPHTTNAPPELTDEERAERRERKRKKKKRIIIAVVSLILVIGSIGGGFGFWAHYQQRVAERREQSEIRAIRREVESLVSEIQSNHRRVERAHTEIQPLIEAARDTAEHMNIPIDDLDELPDPDEEDLEENDDGEAEEDIQANGDAANDEPRREGREAALVRESLEQKREMDGLLEKAQETKESAESRQNRMRQDISLSTAESIRREVQDIERNSSDAVESAQRIARELQRSARRLAELRERFDAEQERIAEAEREERRRAEERERRERERREQEAQTNRELRQLTSTERDLRGLLDDNAFIEAYEQMQGYADDFTTQESQQAFENALERYRYLAQMKENIIDGIQTAPFPWGYGGRDITGASTDGLEVRGATSPIPWSSVDPAQMLRLIDRYIDSRDITPRQRRQIAFGAALYADLFGESARDRARRYANRAMDLGLSRDTYESVLRARWDAEDEEEEDVEEEEDENDE